jgi:hypothetical protein
MTRITFEFSGLGTLVQKGFSGTAPYATMDALTLLLPFARYGGVTHKPTLTARLDQIAFGTPVDRVFSVYDPGGIGGVGPSHTQYGVWDLEDYVVEPKWGNLASAKINVKHLASEPDAPTNEDDTADWLPINWIVDLNKANSPTRVSVAPDCLRARPSHPQLSSKLSISGVSGEFKVLPPDGVPGVPGTRGGKWSFSSTYLIKRPFSDAFEFSTQINLGSTCFRIVLSPFRSGRPAKILEFKSGLTSLWFKIVHLDDIKRQTSAAAEHFAGHYDLTDTVNGAMPEGIAAIEPVFCFAARVDE